MKNSAIILAAGRSTRMKEDKIFLELLGKPVLYHSVKPFEEHKNIEEIIIVTRAENRKRIESIIKQYDLKKIRNVIEGGETRQDSAYEGVKAANKTEIILIHNAANPLIKEKEITNLLKAIEKYGAVAIGYPAKDTIKSTDSKNFATKTLNRKNLWQMQTPQGMRYEIALQAFEQAYKDNFTGTDDASLAERLGYKVKLVECSRENIKITYPEDLKFAEAILKSRK
ncbi:MAG: 2-C-methyl-D-erythritol 4-phosphate cytidylyltransferase [Nanoarchaeota archaeon]|nr:2-C-methyl-D-erythritol 4-phosphate cytidylyltransferase [Nanoarchaeota archaeon]